MDAQEVWLAVEFPSTCLLPEHYSRTGHRREFRRRAECLCDCPDPGPAGACALGDLPPGLEALANWWIIGVSGTLFAVEFIADKIPGFDLLWNALHTFIRVPVAALLAYRATTQLSPGMQVLATAVGATIALAAHGSKTAARALVTPSPEPVSNIALSSSEDVAAVGITWLATQHPWAAASITIALLLASVLMVRWVVKALRDLWERLRPAPAT